MGKKPKQRPQQMPAAPANPIMNYAGTATNPGQGVLVKGPDTNVTDRYNADDPRRRRSASVGLGL